MPNIPVAKSFVMWWIVGPFRETPNGTNRAFVIANL